MNTMNSYIQSSRDRRPVVSLRTNKKAPECNCVSEAMTKLKNHSDATGMKYPIDQTHLEYPLQLLRDRCNNARKEVHLYNYVRDYTPQPRVI